MIPFMENLRIENIEISKLNYDPQNARKHSKANLDAIMGSLKLFGQRKPIIVTPDNFVVAGNGTLQAAQCLGWDEIAITRTPLGWTWDQIKAYALADNRTAELAEWDPQILKEQMLELDANGWELSEFGFESLQPPTEEQAPLKDFPSYDDDDETKYKCPKCSYEWNGAPR